MQSSPDISEDITLETALESALDWWDTLGVETPKITPSRTPPKTTLRRKTAPATTSKPALLNKQAANPAPVALSAQTDEAKRLAAEAKDLDALCMAMSSFDAGALSDNASQCVFARGNPESKLMVIGEAPGREEDAAGKPFMGSAGQLLDRMLAAIGLTEEDVYITNVVNWRPPGNRKPTPEEIELCRSFINRHIELATPDVILIVGGLSLSAMTPLTGIMKNRGTWQNLTFGGREIPALPIYHPAFLLRRPELKKEAWRDLLSLHARLSSETKS